MIAAAPHERAGLSLAKPGSVAVSRVVPCRLAALPPASVRLHHRRRQPGARRSRRAGPSWTACGWPHLMWAGVAWPQGTCRESLVGTRRSPPSRSPTLGGWF